MESSVNNLNDLSKCYLVLGEFLDTLSGLERNCIDLLQCLLRSNYDTAAAIFYNASGPHQYRSLFESLVETECTEAQQAAVSALLGRIKKYAQKRNKIVHGEWMVRIEKEKDEATGVEFRSLQFRLCANSQSKKKREEISNSDNLRGREWFSPSDVIHVTNYVAKLRDDINSVMR